MSIIKVNRIGVTGTRFGATSQQLVSAVAILRQDSSDSIEVHHGACVGVDEQLTIMSIGLGFKIYAHPPIVATYSSSVSLHLSHVVLDPKDYLERNRNIVDTVETLIALPHSRIEVKNGSGTWYTIRYARQQNKNHYIIYPNGKVDGFRWRLYSDL